MAITKENIEKAVRYLDFFESTEEKYQVETESPIDPYHYSTEVNNFIKMLYDESFITPFPWTEWTEEGQRYLDNPTLMEQASMETIQKFLAMIVRGDRFVSGTIAKAIDKHIFTVILRRLKEWE